MAVLPPRGSRTGPRRRVCCPRDSRPAARSEGSQSAQARRHGGGSRDGVTEDNPSELHCRSPLPQAGPDSRLSAAWHKASCHSLPWVPPCWLRDSFQGSPRPRVRRLLRAGTRQDSRRSRWWAAEHQCHRHRNLHRGSSMVHLLKGGRLPWGSPTMLWVQNERRSCQLGDYHRRFREHQHLEDTHQHLRLAGRNTLPVGRLGSGHCEDPHRLSFSCYDR